ncbi:MAG TPA: DUF389 domain-containing protein [Blastocatellia bacterium]|nr:DUF389 domain-containing protein [Blastocatellia bacterium]
MTTDEKTSVSRPHTARIRDWFADHLGAGPERKQTIYADLSSAATVLDATYWLQILFASGIATLGLVLNSPAVIIGAMLISPLMGPILAGGLALATGDVILGLRALVNLVLSCAVAVGFAVLLVGLLPFKEITNEIASRTQPNTLDLMVALFSGAIGSVATCKELKGVVTSIPGVAIAVALMPPLGVVGYGIGVAFTLNATEGMRVAWGGGLLFLTNLVAITFTAMVVFLLLHIDTDAVKAHIEAWRNDDRESVWFRNALGRWQVSERFKKIGSLPGRFLLILIPVLLVLIPLAQSFERLKREIAKERQENIVRRAATELWQRHLGSTADGGPRSFIDSLSVGHQDDKLHLQIRVFTNKPVTNAEKNDYARLLADRLNRIPDAVEIQLIEIPTTSGELASEARRERRAPAPPTVAQLEANLRQGIESTLRGLRLPADFRLIDLSVTTSGAEPMHLLVSYLGDRDIEADARSLIVEDIRTRLSYPTARVDFARTDSSFGPLLFGRNQLTVQPAHAVLLDRVGEALRREPTLLLEIIVSPEDREEIAKARAQAVAQYLTSKWHIEDSRITVTVATGPNRDVILEVTVGDTPP